MKGRGKSKEVRKLEKGWEVEGKRGKWRKVEGSGGKQSEVEGSGRK